ncbi:MAG: translocation/assembly module TamB domain-containing protein [Bacteroidota bacterium]
MPNSKKEEPKRKNKTIKILAKILAGLFIFIILLILFIRSPWGQGIIVDKLTNSISNKTNTKVEIEKLFITFDGNISLEGLYLEDQKSDTLIYSRSLEADVPLWPLIKGDGISVNFVDWEGLRANVIRKDSAGGFNYQFLLDAYVTSDPNATSAEDTTATTKFNIGELSFRNFDLTFKDDVSGIDSRLKMDKLDLEMEETDLENMKFHISNAHLANTSIYYDQTKALPESEDSDAPLPFLIVDRLQLENVNVNYASKPDGILSILDVGEFMAESAELNLENNLIAIDEILLNNSEVLVETTTIEQEPELKEDSPGNQDFEWPEWTVNVNSISLENNNFSYFVDGAMVEKGIFNPDAIVLKDFNFTAENIFLAEETAGLHLNEFNFNEASGYQLKEFVLDLELDENSLELDGLSLHLNENRLNGKLTLDYNSIDEFINNPENAQISAELNQINFWLRDLFPFQPELKQNEYLVELSKKVLTGNLKVDGSLSSLEIPSANFKWGQNTALNATGTVENPMDTEKLGFNFPSFSFSSTRSDVVGFVKEEDLGIKVPAQLSLRGSIEGSPENIKTAARLQTSQGAIAVNGSFSGAETISYTANVDVMELNLGELLQNENLGTLNMELSSRGSGENINVLNATLESTITSLKYSEYSIKDWKIQGEIENGNGTITSAYKDENLDAALQAYVELDSISPKVIADLEVKGADLQALGLTSRNIRGALQLNATFQGNAEDFEFSSNITDGVVVYDDQSYLLGDLDVSAYVRTDTTSLNIKNKMVDLQLQSNASPEDFTNAISRHYESYFTDEILTDTVENPVELKLRGHINQSPIINDVFITNLTELDTVDINVDFSEKNRTLVAAVELPYINYNGNIIDSLSFSLNSDKENFNFNFGFNALDAGPLAVKNTFLDGSIENKMLNLDFNSYYEDEKLVHIASVISKQEDIFRVHLVPEELILNYSEWNIPESNEVLIGEKSIRFNDFLMSRGNQEIEISNSMPEAQKEHIGIGFKNFNLEAVFSYLNPEESLASGNLNGNFIIEEPFSSTGLLANLEIQNLKVMDVPLGVLNLEAIAEGGDNYNLDLSIKGGDADLDLTGTYVAAETGAEVDLDLQINELKMEAIEGFSDGAINTTSGSISGQMNLSGTLTEPEYDGDFRFNNAAFTVATLNAPFRIEDETLRLDTDGVYFDDFRINDTKNNSFVVKGEVLTENLLNPKFDLQFEATNFNVLNSTAEDNELYYGTASFDGTARLTGDLDLPKLDVNITVGSNTNVTYVIPEESLAIQERDGVVIFVNREDPDDILTKSSEEESAIISGVDIRALISIGDGATFTIILDEQTEDNFRVKGEGDFNFNIYPNGRTTLSGRYEMSGGHYEMSLYGLVKRRFEIASGSTITWAGDPLDANLDIRAIYKVETSASGLMATQTAGADASVRGRFRQQLPFLVYLNVDGELMQPKISFNLDMPESEQGAIGGRVYGRLQQLNNQEQELNKQVFSLLVLNKFFPESVSDGSGGGTVTVARDNLNQALSDQLNIFSEKLLGDTGVELDFDVDSFTDYQGESPQERTQVEITAQKKLLDDRLIVRVGSDVDIQGSSQVQGEESPIIGNVSIEYLLTEDGIFRIKGFRKNQFENVIDGQLIISGVAFIFTREFNEFTELWENFLKEGTENSEE